MTPLAKTWNCDRSREAFQPRFFECTGCFKSDGTASTFPLRSDILMLFDITPAKYLSKSALARVPVSIIGRSDASAEEAGAFAIGTAPVLPVCQPVNHVFKA